MNGLIFQTPQISEYNFQTPHLSGKLFRPLIPHKNFRPLSLLNEISDPLNFRMSFPDPTIVLLN